MPTNTPRLQDSPRIAAIALLFIVTLVGFYFPISHALFQARQVRNLQRLGQQERAYYAAHHNDADQRVLQVR